MFIFKKKLFNECMVNTVPTVKMWLFLGKKKNQKDFNHLFLFLLSIKGGHVRVVDRGTCLSLVSVLHCHLVTERKFKIWESNCNHIDLVSNLIEHHKSNSSEVLRFWSLNQPTSTVLICWVKNTTDWTAMVTNTRTSRFLSLSLRPSMVALTGSMRPECQVSMVMRWEQAFL